MLAAYCNRKDIVDHLLHLGARVNSIDDHGYTLLHWASSNTGWTDIVRLILDNGEADLNAVDHLGRTPLLWAARRGDEGVAALLIRAGADVNRSDTFKRTALHYAVERGLTTVIQILLEKEGLDLSAQDIKGNTPLHVACMYRPEAIKQLLEAGADTHMKNDQGETALSVIIGHNTLTIEKIRLFVQKGAFLENCDYMRISFKPFLKENILKDVELCTQSVVNKFHHQSLPALNSITYFARRLPNVNNFKLGARHIDEVENLVKCEIERNTFCNVVKVHPISLSALCVLSLITCQSGKKRAASPGFGHTPFKIIHN
ncbi:hypothetical protein JTE90_028896 [Oedothorax gibbosus]|uniref:Uncharacterized protein n=1 Tax=Oedothorax gibbosus TaxID=931172 RepID=A0AAV6URH9_9ARAC|nr:hypothetical protein JTE90_028896 [Oedothorax gibbosus]